MTFALDLKRFGELTEDRLNLVVRKVSFDLFARIIMRTPVDTGRARANWFASVNSASIETTEDTDPGPVNGQGTGDSAARARAQAVTLQAKAGDRIFLMNSLPYILALEDGHSKQAAAGMVKVTLQDYPGIVRKGTAEARRERR